VKSLSGIFHRQRPRRASEPQGGRDRDAIRSAIEAAAGEVRRRRAAIRWAPLALPVGAAVVAAYLAGCSL
jgi:hypothetical protein